MSVMPSAKGIRHISMLGLFWIFSFSVRMEIVSGDWFSGSATLPYHRVLSKMIRPLGLRHFRAGSRYWS